MKTIEDYIARYGFCNWQAQELLKRLAVAEEALEAVTAFTAERKGWLDTLSPELQAVEDQCKAAIKTLNATLP